MRNTLLGFVSTGLKLELRSGRRLQVIVLPPPVPYVAPNYTPEVIAPTRSPRQSYVSALTDDQSIVACHQSSQRSVKGILLVPEKPQLKDRMDSIEDNMAELHCAMSKIVAEFERLSNRV
ncbi:hypothetical protein H6P81_010976 [Aristolochia fimbriata]|uniref:V-SNARE coiled-coil homology domain-containing protein n=1 Tax=Aristolochia fimbriata TaxID=158543 RepID=A0AAV7ERE1_ARIFI|nr:hypothetical protein H6P81_010976 [Aristolochia fimbriata]